MMRAETVVTKVHSGLSKTTTNTRMARIALKSEIKGQTECDASLVLSHTGQLDENRTFLGLLLIYDSLRTNN